MNAPSLDDIVRHLENQRVQVAAKSAQLHDAVAAIEAELARLDGAIAALRGKPLTGPSGMPTTAVSAKRKAAAPAASRDQVADLMTSTLRQHGMMLEEKLKVAVENQLVAAGFSRMGYALRFKEAMVDGRFASVDGGVTLRRTPAGAASPTAGQVAGEMTPQNGHQGNFQKTLQT
jgi:hypothetical protein